MEEKENFQCLEKPVVKILKKCFNNRTSPKKILLYVYLGKNI